MRRSPFLLTALLLLSACASTYASRPSPDLDQQLVALNPLCLIYCQALAEGQTAEGGDRPVGSGTVSEIAERFGVEPPAQPETQAPPG